MDYWSVIYLVERVHVALQYIFFSNTSAFKTLNHVSYLWQFQVSGYKVSIKNERALMKRRMRVKRLKRFVGSIASLSS